MLEEVVFVVCYYSSPRMILGHFLFTVEKSRAAGFTFLEFKKVFTNLPSEKINQAFSYNGGIVVVINFSQF